MESHPQPIDATLVHVHQPLAFSYLTNVGAFPAIAGPHSVCIGVVSPDVRCSDASPQESDLGALLVMNVQHNQSPRGVGEVHVVVHPRYDGQPDHVTSMLTRLAQQHGTLRGLDRLVADDPLFAGETHYQVNPPQFKIAHRRG